MTPQILRLLLQAQSDRQRIVLATRLSDGLQYLFPGLQHEGEVKSVAEQVLLLGKSEKREIAGESWFFHLHEPPSRLLIIGAVHIAQSLAPLALAAGFDVEVNDPRRHFATPARFPNVTLSHTWPDDAVRSADLDSLSALVVLTHDPKLDDGALGAALGTEAFYIGALGSRATHARRIERLRELGHTDAALARIRGPVGLPIGALGAPEIAVSIVADLVAVRRHAPLADRAIRLA